VTSIKAFIKSSKKNLPRLDIACAILFFTFTINPSIHNCIIKIWDSDDSHSQTQRENQLASRKSGNNTSIYASNQFNMPHGSIKHWTWKRYEHVQWNMFLYMRAFIFCRICKMWCRRLRSYISFASYNINKYKFSVLHVGTVMHTT